MGIEHFELSGLPSSSFDWQYGLFCYANLATHRPASSLLRHLSTEDR